MSKIGFDINQRMRAASRAVSNRLKEDGGRYWNAVGTLTGRRDPESKKFLDKMRLEGDSLADETVRKLFEGGPKEVNVTSQLMLHLFTYGMLPGHANERAGPATAPSSHDAPDSGRASASGPAAGGSVRIPLRKNSPDNLQKNNLRTKCTRGQQKFLRLTLRKVPNYPSGTTRV
jgi:hypothetical protein